MDDDIIPLDFKTMERLTRLSEATGEPVPVLAAKILHDVLEDDEAAHADCKLYH